MKPYPATYQQLAKAIAECEERAARLRREAAEWEAAGFPFYALTFRGHAGIAETAAAEYRSFIELGV